MKFSKIKTVMICVIFMSLFTGCQSDKYDYLKTDIVGAWCDEDGPELTENEILGQVYRIYEFTEDGTVCYYYVAEDENAYRQDSQYEIDGNLFSSEGAMCRIDVKDNILTMTTDNGSSRYRRMDAAELLDYNILAQGAKLTEEQDAIMNSMLEVSETAVSSDAE